MRRGMWIGIVLLMVAAGILIGVASYHAGVNHGIQQAGDAGRIVQVYGYGGGFPFGFLIFPLVIFGIFAIAAGARRRRWAAMGGGPGNWGGPGKWGFDSERVAEMHRRLHEADHPGAGGEPSAGVTSSA
ncbi:MAG TPA: hypothetical protein VNN79_13890 [Actinomycetota bacterium]|nr:hypothetical protein [Actinomycetota bacterium]